MKERIEKIMSLYSLTSVKMAEIMNVQPSNISHIISGRNNPSYDFIAKLLGRFPELSPDWIISGSGDIYRSKPSVNINVNKGLDTFVNASQGNYNSLNRESESMFNISSNNDLPVSYHENTNVNHKPLLEISPDVTNHLKMQNRESILPDDSNDYYSRVNNAPSDKSTKIDSSKPRLNTQISTDPDAVSQTSKEIKTPSQKSIDVSSEPQNSTANQFHTDYQSIPTNLTSNTDKSVKKIIFIYTDNTFDIFSN